MRRALRLFMTVATALLLAMLAFVGSRSATGDGPFSTPSDLAAAPLAGTAPPGAAPGTGLTVPLDTLAHAPSGRTGIARVDAAVDALVTFDAGALAALAGVTWEGIDDCATTRPRALDARTMTDAFASARPPLHSLFTSDPVEAIQGERYSVVFGHGRRSGAGIAEPRAWRIDVSDGRVSGVAVYCGFTDVLFEPQLGEIERYLLLPPERDLPPPVALYAAAPTTGRLALDTIVSEAVAGDAAALAVRLSASALACATTEGGPIAAPRCDGGRSNGARVSVIPLHVCGRIEFVDLAAARDRLTSQLEGPAPALHAIATPPPVPVAGGDALVLLSRETRRYNWTSFGLVVAGDALSALVLPCGDGRPEWLYPPLVLAGPFADAVNDSGPTWSGIPVVDRAIVAISNGDAARLRDSFDPVLIGCVAEPSGIGSSPLCLANETPGTLVPVLPIVSCEIEYVREQAFVQLAQRLAGMAPRLYAVTAPPRGYAELWRLAHYTLLLFDAAAGSDRYPTIAISEAGIAGFATGCGGSLTSNLLRPAIDPKFLVAPPR